jgi:putative membrane protein
MPLRNLIATVSAFVLIGVGAPAQARPVSPDADFLIAAHQGNLAQIAAGRIAKRKGTTEPVREFGRAFVAYHRKLDVAVREAAADLDVTLPTEPNSEQQALVAQYRSTAGTEFDTLFVGSQLIAHEHAIKLARVVLDTGTEPVVEKLVTDALPVIEKHQEELRTLTQR